MDGLQGGLLLSYYFGIVRSTAVDFWGVVKGFVPNTHGRSLPLFDYYYLSAPDHALKLPFVVFISLFFATPWQQQHVQHVATTTDKRDTMVWHGVKN